MMDSFAAAGQSEKAQGRSKAAFEVLQPGLKRVWRFEGGICFFVGSVWKGI